MFITAALCIHTVLNELTDFMVFGTISKCFIILTVALVFDTCRFFTWVSPFIAITPDSIDLVTKKY